MKRFFAFFDTRFNTPSVVIAHLSSRRGLYSVDTDRQWNPLRDSLKDKMKGYESPDEIIAALAENNFVEVSDGHNDVTSPLLFEYWEKYAPKEWMSLLVALIEQEKLARKSKVELTQDWDEALDILASHPGEFKKMTYWVEVVEKFPVFEEYMANLAGFFQPLEGSEKQVAWALKLRQTLARHFVRRLLLSEMKWAMGSKEAPSPNHSYNFVVEWLEPQSQDWQAVVLALQNTVSRTKASYFIDNRDNDIFREIFLKTVPPRNPEA